MTRNTIPNDGFTAVAQYVWRHPIRIVSTVYSLVDCIWHNQEIQWIRIVIYIFIGIFERSSDFCCLMLSPHFRIEITSKSVIEQDGSDTSTIQLMHTQNVRIELKKGSQKPRAHFFLIQNSFLSVLNNTFSKLKI